ncbi:hypothetical protein BN179_3040018 [Clostridioides difficile T6]|nr:hypothetical protein BN179_3040018 [Clostridioides difficile T6]CCL55100.1 hypothetical protein BN180_2590021 [Clostridioides difficile E14]CCL66972.1 hypothetical protein BN183_3680029 [Clostridioides difficile E7]
MHMRKTMKKIIIIYLFVKENIKNVADVEKLSCYLGLIKMVKRDIAQIVKTVISWWGKVV